LDTYEFATVWDTPDLIRSLAQHASLQRRDERHPAEQIANGKPDKPPSILSSGTERQASPLLLRVTAAAEYFTDRAALMREVPPVYVDIILDPYLLNILPRSLLPTVIYIIILMPFAWLVARTIASWVGDLASPNAGERSKKDA
jgi:hypothetical protein